MKLRWFPSPRLIDAAHLRRIGFTTEQIAWLCELREDYPLCEHIESRLQRQRLTFMKWCYVTGRIDG